METSGNDFKTDLTKHIRERRHHSGRGWAGIILVGVGALLLAQRFGAEIPYWLLTWPMLLIAVGLFIGIRHSFRSMSWMFPVVIGSIFLAEELLPDVSVHQYLWPIIIIAIGLLMIARPRRKKNDYWRSWEQYTTKTSDDSSNSADDVVDSVAVFGSTKKNIISKDFKGGEMTSFFGGNDLNLMQADFNGIITLEITNVFGGTKLIVPPHWNIKSEVVCVFGDVDDKRPYIKESVDPTKALKLVGTCVFGGIEIKSHQPY